MNLRKRKTARIKITLLNLLLNLIGKGSFKDLYVENICEKAEISKVTFFKYFPQKEDLLFYYMVVWNFLIAVELRKQPKSGIDAITFLFSTVARDVEKRPGLIPSLIGYVSGLKNVPATIDLPLEERILLFPEETDLDKITILSSRQRFEKHIEEAKKNGEINQKCKVEDVSGLISSIFYGSAISTQLYQVENIHSFYMKNLKQILAGLRKNE